MKKDSRIYVAGHTGLVGSAIVRELRRKGYENILYGRGDLRIKGFVIRDTPEYVFNCAAHAGGIQEAIDKPAEMLFDNLMIQANVINACKVYRVKKLLNLGSSCIYPVDGKQPYTEEQLGTGKTDENWSYAVAKLAGIELCRAYHKQYGCNFMTAIPCNLYGINDNFGDNGHVIPMLIRKFHETEYGTVKVWGNGQQRREFLYSDDFAEAAVILMEKCDYRDLHNGVINIGTMKNIKIRNLASRIKSIVGSKAKIHYDIMKPSGISSKIMDSNKIRKLGWEPKTSQKRGIKQTYDYYRTSCESG